jgi:histidine triad (HIT) family protein
MAQENMTPEQIKALQEKIKQMSPEELKEFQKKQCIFCQIISGKIQAKIIYEDEKVLAILDINPANPGHAVLLTKEHYSIMPQLSDELVNHVFNIAKSLSNTMLRSIDAQGTNILVANGIAAGQRAQHFMAHIIPRKENDGVNFVLPQKTLDQNDIELIGNKLIEALGQKPQETPPARQEKSPIIKKGNSLNPAVPNEDLSQKESQEDREQTKEVNENNELDKAEEEEDNKVDEPKDENNPKKGIDLDSIAKLLGAK